MKSSLLSLLIFFLFLFTSCEKETILTVNQSSLSFENKGGNQTVNLVANKLWSASSNQSWCKVSPSSGDGSENSNITISVSCEANDSYDERACSITVSCGELTKTIAVSQAEGKGLILSQTEYNLTNEEQTIYVEVKANVQYSVEIDNACKSWIKQASTKGLSSNIIQFTISKNNDYDGREGKITIKQTDGSLSGTVVVRQSQQNGLYVEKTEYDVSYEEQLLNVKVKSNIKFEVQIDESCKEWISNNGTKGLTESTVSLAISQNEKEEREGRVVLKYANLQVPITVKQASGIIVFEDANFKAFCVEHYDKNHDGEISFFEASSVTKMECMGEGFFSLGGISSLGEIRYFTALTYLDCGFNQITELDVENNKALVTLRCYFNELSSLSLSGNPALMELHCGSNKITSLDLSNNTSVENINCQANQLSSLDISKCVSLKTLACNSNKLTTLNVSNNSALSQLWCGSNPLTSLDVSKNTELTWLWFSSTQLASLDVSNNNVLNILWCFNNPYLKEIWLKKNQEIEDFQYDTDIATIKYR